MNTGKVRISGFTFLAFIMLYCLFALNRVKYSIPLTVNGVLINNTSFVILMAFIIAILMLKLRGPQNVGIGAIICCYFIIEVFISVLCGSTFGEAVYAVAMLVVPFCGFFIASRLGHNNINKMHKFIILCAGVYALLALIISANYNAFARLLGVSEITTYSKFARVNMPIGSSITVCYFLNITLPFCAIGIEQYKENKTMRIISMGSLALSVICTVLLNSRAAIITMVVVAVMFMNYSKTIMRKGMNNLLYITVAALCVFYFLCYGGIDRFINRTTPMIESDMTRFREIMLALEIFSKNPLFGTGLGTVYQRTHSGTLDYNGVKLLSDPHNAYALLLSEIGIVAAILIGVFFIILVRKINKKRLTRGGFFVAKTLIVSILIQSLFGAHIINEPSYSVIFWILLGVAMNNTQRSEEKKT